MIRPEHRNATAGDVLARLGGGGGKPPRRRSGGSGCGSGCGSGVLALLAVVVAALAVWAVTTDG